MSESGTKQSENAPAAEGKPDDLLAQLAGAEVDRLLAEAELDQKSLTGEPAAPVEDEEAAALKSMLQESAEQELTEAIEATAQEEAANAAAETAAPAEAAAAESDGAQADVSNQLNELFSALTSPEKNKPKSESEETAVEAGAPAAGAEPAADAELEEEAVVGEEKSALDEEMYLPGTNVATPLPWWGKLLYWMNAPFEFLPERTREVLGWIGVLTLCNAAMILAYVYFVRGKK